MADVTMTYASLETAANNVNTAKADLEQVIAMMTNAVSALEGNWSGDSYNAFVEAWHTSKPTMEKLAEAYMAINTGVTIDIQQTGSGTGITSTIDGSCEIGMSSRDLKDEELAEGLTPVTIALDGIAVIVNLENAVEDLTSEQIRQIYVGELTDWSQIG